MIWILSLFAANQWKCLSMKHLHVKLGFSRSKFGQTQSNPVKPSQTTFFTLTVKSHPVENDQASMYHCSCRCLVNRPGQAGTARSWALAEEAMSHRRRAAGRGCPPYLPGDHCQAGAFSLSLPGRFLYGALMAEGETSNGRRP